MSKEKTLSQIFAMWPNRRVLADDLTALTQEYTGVVLEPANVRRWGERHSIPQVYHRALMISAKCNRVDVKIEDIWSAHERAAAQKMKEKHHE